VAFLLYGVTMDSESACRLVALQHKKHGRKAQESGFSEKSLSIGIGSALRFQE
jgi:hypothetical protein